MKKLFLFILLSLGLSATSYAGPYDDWSDDAVCMWLEQKPTHAGYLGEAKKRGISCEGGIKPGWKFQENSNFLVIDDESSYWETDEGIKEKTKLHSHRSSATSGSSSSSGAPSCYVPPNCAPGQTCC